ncbi:GntR family transcriptional regulator [Paraburkholderia guartelaensis]|uniref:GntR family transcriptional regulator n=1 Tax=Paraburkholderia guartelaensis TaxID=2546446 RepID=UPI002AB65FBC|nr:GntR family transcriptional regulator [Paraburkholderia guartelaensis]
MARQKTQELPDLGTLLKPRDQLMLAVEDAVLRGNEWAQASMPVAAQIAARIAGAITLNHIEAGKRLLEGDIGEVLHVSRAPVREALRILERDRLVAFEARRGAIVTQPDARELRDIFAVRTVLYSALIEELLAERPEELGKVFDEHVKALERTMNESLDAYVLEGFLLNFAVFDLSSNLVLADMLKSISLRVLRYNRLAFAMHPGSIAQSIRGWRDLRRAVASRDLARVLKCVRARMDTSRDNAIRAVEKPEGGTPARRKARAA